jgi:hypothetical protein
VTRSPLQKRRAVVYVRAEHSLELLLIVEAADQAGKITVAGDDHRAIVVRILDHRLEHQLGVHVPFRFAVIAVRDLLEDEQIAGALKPV